MNAPKCKGCGKAEWNHVCGGIVNPHVRVEKPLKSNVTSMPAPSRNVTDSRDERIAHLETELEMVKGLYDMALTELAEIKSKTRARVAKHRAKASG
jgi:hypothetical protein